MNRLVSFTFLAVVALCANAATLRVNNASNTAAQFNNVDDALQAAQEGDVIILEPSPTSYGDFEVGKKVTIKGGGYFLDVNEISYEGAAASKVNDVTITAEGAMVTGLECNNITVSKGANNVTITRNKIQYISLGGTFGYDITEETAVAGTIIHQNILFGIDGPSYGAYATGIQVTNNIFWADYNAGGVSRIQNSIFRYNTYGSCNRAIFDRISNCVFEHNMGGQPEKMLFGEGNSYQDNHPGGDEKLYGEYGWSQLARKCPDKIYKETDANISTEHGAFAGETPYVLSGIPSGPVIIDLELPNAVEKGEDLRVSVTIGTQK